MLVMNELLNGADFNSLTKDIQDSLTILLERMNKLRVLWGRPMQVTSGLRTMKHHIEIYQRTAERKGITFDMSQVPLKSKHLYGQAVDILDPVGSLYNWCKSNTKVLEDCKLWCEDDMTVPRIHFQIVPPTSNSRWFKP